MTIKFPLLPVVSTGNFGDMRNNTKRTKAKAIPRTNLRWQTREQYDRVKAAAGTIPLATFVLDVVVRSLDKRDAA